MLTAEPSTLDLFLFHQLPVFFLLQSVFLNFFSVFLCFLLAFKSFMM